MPATIRGTVARRQGQQQQQSDPEKALEVRVKHALNWFGAVSPQHVDPEQFVNLCLSVLRRNPKLMRAAMETPLTFMAAASECARLGLAPDSDEYYFVPFRNKVKEQDEEGRWHERYENQVQGITGYKGELNLIYRAGEVRAVHCHVVREKDEFTWRPGSMEVPHHVIHAPDFAQHQMGLAGDTVEERGILTGVYAYAEMIRGGFSQPVVMGASTVKRYRAVAKTDAFWGPEWPEESSWTTDMWRKTAIHRLYDLVPHSTEYRAELMRVAAQMEKHADENPAKQVQGSVVPPERALMEAAAGQQDSEG